MMGVDGGADLGARPGWRWDVALSFASAQRDYVEQVAAALQARGVRCFHDADEHTELWGKYLAEELPAIYAEQAAAVVVFVSAEYAARDWTRLERRAALSRAVRERREYVLPARFDDTPLPGLLSDMVTVDVRTKTPQQFAAMIAVKLATLAITGPAPSADAGDPAQDAGSARPTGAVRAAEADQQRLGGHAATSMPGVPDEVLSEHVPRDVDASEFGVRARASQLGFGKSLMGPIAVAAVVLAGAGYLVAHHGVGAAGAAAGGAGPVADQFIYTARTANDAPITLPDAVRNDLLQIGLAHESIALTRVDSTGNVSTSYIDMTPRTGNSSNDPVLVTGPALLVIGAKISGIETAINSPAATTGDGQALYAGLTRTDFTGGPVTIISSGIDLANPDNFRSLKWSVPPEEVVAEVEKAGGLPTLHGPVTFVIAPTAGPQPQLGQAQKNYLTALWSALLKAAGAPSVTFIGANAATASSGGPSAPIVPLPGLPGTPIPPESKGRTG
jgi:hypothetical protein